MISLKQTSSDDSDFRELVKLLDAHFAIVDGKDHDFYSQYNKLDAIKHVIVAYVDGEPAGCGALKKYDEKTMEVKRMFVKPEFRRGGIARSVLMALEKWAAELGYSDCVLETTMREPAAIKLYERNGYSVIPNYGQYENVETSVCFRKDIRKMD